MRPTWTKYRERSQQRGRMSSTVATRSSTRIPRLGFPRRMRSRDLRPISWHSGLHTRVTADQGASPRHVPSRRTLAHSRTRAMRWRTTPYVFQPWAQNSLPKRDGSSHGRRSALRQELPCARTAALVVRSVSVRAGLLNCTGWVPAGPGGCASQAVARVLARTKVRCACRQLAHRQQFSHLLPNKPMQLTAELLCARSARVIFFGRN